jgi:hypothetical protein
MRKLRIKFLSHSTQRTFEQTIDGDLELWQGRFQKQLFDGDSGKVYTPIEITDLGYTDDQMLQMLHEEQLQQQYRHQD